MNKNQKKWLVISIVIIIILALGLGLGLGLGLKKTDTRQKISAETYLNPKLQKTHNGAILILAPPRNMKASTCTAQLRFKNLDRFCLLKQAVKSVDKNLNVALNKKYPIYIILASDPESDPSGLDAEYTREDRENLQKYAPNSIMFFVKIPMYSGEALPPNTSPSDVDSWNQGKNGGVPGRPLGYRSMCRLFSGRLQSLSFLDQYDFYMRMDDDSYFKGPLKKDPFDEFKKLGLDYAFHRRASDPHGIHKLREIIKEFGKWSEIDPPYNNFHIVNVSVFRSHKFKKLWDRCNEEKLFMKYRVGDALFHGALLEAFNLKYKQFDWLTYIHNVNDDPNYPPKHWEDECRRI